MKNGLCLAGGGVKGAAHIGAIKALEEENIKFQYIGGTSSGSIVACLYACGFTSDEMYEIFKKYCKKIKYVDSTPDTFFMFFPKNFHQALVKAGKEPEEIRVIVAKIEYIP